MHGMSPLVFSAHTAMTQWELSPFALLMLVTVLAAGAWYLRGVHLLASRGRRWSTKRTVSFLGGLVGIDIALQSPVAAFTADYFQAHVIQHLLLMVVAPPLLAMGAPMTLALQTSGRQTKVRLLGILNSGPFQVLTHPVPVWFLYYFSMFAFFLTFALGFAMGHMWVMDLINLTFFFASTLFWWPLVGLDPIPHWQMSHGVRLTNLLIGVPLESFLALALLSSSRPAASMYSVSSTHAGAAILWIGAELLTFLAIIPVFVQWVRFEERKGARLDAQLDAELAASGVPASPAAET
ncbi:MAG: cytochrome c oxidase assembly protein [Acidimicrobiales bacterium]